MAGDAFQKLRSSVNRGITTISVKTSSSLEKAKLRTHIESIETEIQRLIVSAGEMAYAKWEQKDSEYAPLEAIFQTISQKKSEIAALTEELNGIDERDNQILGSAAAETPAVLVCPGCGAQYDTTVRFCRQCGHRLQD